MIGDTLSSQNTDTLSLLQQKQISPAKADSDSLQLADLHAVQEVDSGFEGTPISYSPRTDDAIALTLLACFFHRSGSWKEVSHPTGERLCVTSRTDEYF